MKVINVAKAYTLKEVIDLELIPYIDSTRRLYEMVTVRVPDKTLKKGYRTQLVSETSRNKIKPVQSKAPWGGRINKVKIRGIEIVKFLKLYNLI